jgi:myo-inositol-1(or 4)-monophosphatase
MDVGVWLELCRRCGRSISDLLARNPSAHQRARTAGQGEGGDTALVIDRSAEDVVFSELEALGTPLSVISEERGHVSLAGGGYPLVVVDPIDGSLNAKRGLAPYSLSIAVASGETMDDVWFGYVCDLSRGEEWWATRNGGAFLGRQRLARPEGSGLELLGIEGAKPGRVSEYADRLAGTDSRRLRTVGSIALSLCYVAAGRLDGLITLEMCRSVDCAAGQLVVQESAGQVVFCDAHGAAYNPSLGLDARFRLIAGCAAHTESLLEVVRTH